MAQHQFPESSKLALTIENIASEYKGKYTRDSRKQELLYHMLFYAGKAYENEHYEQFAKASEYLATFAKEFYNGLPPNRTV